MLAKRGKAVGQALFPSSSGSGSWKDPDGQRALSLVLHKPPTSEMDLFEELRVALTIVDKVLFLQNVDIFNHATTEELAYVGSIAKELKKLKDETVFRQDESADAMYVVVKGRVRLHKDGQEILVVAEKEAFGTWALFDNEPRIMTATALEDVHLLRIDQEEFYDLLADHVEITQSIFKALVQRIKRLVEG